MGSTSNVDGELSHLVVQNLEDKLHDSLPNTSRSTTVSPTAIGANYLQVPEIPQIDVSILNNIEIEAQYLATSVNNLTENLSNLLHSISSITSDTVELHRSAVNKLTDGMDANIKCAYTIMAKTEEITTSMRATELLGARIREIKRMVDILDSSM